MTFLQKYHRWSFNQKAMFWLAVIGIMSGLFLQIRSTFINKIYSSGNQNISIDNISGTKIVNNYASSSVNNILSGLLEYIFVNQYCYVQAFVSDDKKVIAYSITSRDKYFNPKFNLTDMGFDSQIELGVTKFYNFSDGSVAKINNYYLMAHYGYYYSEQYFLGRPSKYQTIYLSLNDNGNNNAQELDLSIFDQQNLSISSPVIQKFRQDAIVDTITITAPFVDLSEITRLHLGPQYEQVWLLDDSTVKNKWPIDKKKLMDNIKLLYPESNITDFIKLLGEPAFINKIH